MDILDKLQKILSIPPILYLVSSVLYELGDFLGIVLLENVGYSIALVLLFTTPFWGVPGVIVAIISFRRNYKEIRLNNLPKISIIKKSYLFTIYFLAILYFLVGMILFG